MIDTLGPYELGRVHCVDALAGLKQLPDACVQCVVTSPPYWGLRDYGVDGQMGLESTPDEYIERMVAVFREVRRVLRGDGTLWLNMGDKYNSPNTHSGEVDKVDWRVRLNQPAGTTNTLKPKDLCGMPWRLALVLQADGWWLRSDIIWSKPNPMPESVTDRPTRAHEYVFLMTQSARYFYDADAVREPASCPGRTYSEDTAGHKTTALKDAGNRTTGGLHDGRKTYGNPEKGRNRRTVWTIATHGFPDAHFATFPKKLVEPCIMAGTGTGDIVLDPFAGAATTLVTAINLNRRAIGFELSPEYTDMANARIKRETAQEILDFD